MTHARAGLLATLLLLACAAPATAAWAAPAEIGGSAGGQDPSVGVDAAGNAVVVWSAVDDGRASIRARARSVAGSLGPTRDISAAGADAGGPQVAVSGSGEAVVVWAGSEDGRAPAQARRLSATGILGPIVTLSSPRADAVVPRVALDARGTAQITWQVGRGFKTRVQARSLSADGARGRLATLSLPGASTRAPQVAVNAAGRAVFAWSRRLRGAGDDDAYPLQRIETRARSATGRLGRIVNLSGRGRRSLFEARVAIDAGGDAVYAWDGFDGFDIDDQRGFFVHTRGRSARGRLSRLSRVARGAIAPTLALDGRGHAVIVYERVDAPNANYRVRFRRRSPRGALGRPVEISAASIDAREPQVAIAPDGATTFSWTDDIAGEEKVQARSRSASGRLGPTATLSSNRRLIEFFGDHSHRLAIGAGGDAVVAWAGLSGGEDGSFVDLAALR